MTERTVSPENILKILQKDVAGLDTVGFDDSLRDKLDLDSLDLSLFFLNVQETYGVQITDDDVAQIDSINSVVGWLREKMMS